jgi:hypothetical protein
MTADDDKSQPDIFINVYTRGALSGMTRVGYTRRRLKEFGKYEPGNPCRPKFYALEPMPYNAKQLKLPISVLLSLEHHVTDDVNRHNRKSIRQMSYIVRAYVFMARNISSQAAEAEAYSLRVSCAGVTKYTDPDNRVRPMWMKNIDLMVKLMSDHPKEPPTMEPITVALVVRGTMGINALEKDIGKVVCKYEYMRQKDNMGRWETYQLQPQWVEVRGGSYGSIVTGEVLIAFELLHFRYWDEPELKPKELWPQLTDLFKKN